MTEFPKGRSLRASSTSSLDPMDDWLASADDPSLASSSTVLPNRIGSRTGYSLLSLGRKEFHEHEQPYEGYDAISQLSTYQQQLVLNHGLAPPSSDTTIRQLLSSSLDSMRDSTFGSAPPLNPTDSSRLLSATTHEPSVLFHRAYMSEPRAALEHEKYRAEPPKPLAIWDRPEGSEPSLLDLASRFPLRQEVTVKNGVRVVLYFCGVL
ncbi:hypothetical protein LTR01_001752 [Friedmanniomyces endolithicus]|nr:hypothetical protein LTR01_001752 [Friedmanniomyces endolithicus]KAK0830286.1 hypothetical protein LTR73_003564 [Friedmanniomyces endolithicus]